MRAKRLPNAGDSMFSPNALFTASASVAASKLTPLGSRSAKVTSTVPHTYAVTAPTFIHVNLSRRRYTLTMNVKTALDELNMEFAVTVVINKL